MRQTKGEDSRHRKPNLISFRVSFGAEEPRTEQRPDHPGRELTRHSGRTKNISCKLAAASIKLDSRPFGISFECFNIFQDVSIKYNIRISKNNVSISLSLSTCIIMYHMISCRIMCNLNFNLKY